MTTVQEKRRRVERRIARRVILDALKAGYAVSLWDGQEVVVKKATTAKAVLGQMFSVDQEYLLFHKDGKRAGWVFLVYGNGGWDVVADATAGMDPILEGAKELSDLLGQT